MYISQASFPFPVVNQVRNFRNKAIYFPSLFFPHYRSNFRVAFSTHHPALLPAVVWPHGDRLVPARPGIRPPAPRFRRVLVVQGGQEAVEASPFRGMQELDATDQDTVAESRKGLRVGAPEGTSAEVAVEG